MDPNARVRGPYQSSEYNIRFLIYSTLSIYQFYQGYYCIKLQCTSSSADVHDLGSNRLQYQYIVAQKYKKQQQQHVQHCIQHCLDVLIVSNVNEVPVSVGQSVVGDRNRSVCQVTDSR